MIIFKGWITVSELDILGSDGWTAEVDGDSELIKLTPPLVFRPALETGLRKVI